MNLSRSGEPENGHTSRKPLARYRWYDSGTSLGRLLTIAKVGGAVPICEA